MNGNIKAFVSNLCSCLTKITIYLVIKAYISLLFVKKVIIFAKSLDVINIVLKQTTIIMFNYIKTNEFAILSEKNKYLHYKVLKNKNHWNFKLSRLILRST